MIKKIKNNSIEKYINILLILFFLILILVNIKSSVVSVKNALSLWFNFVLPTLFPFMFFTSLIVNNNYFDFFNFIGKFFKNIFNAPIISGYIFFMSVICGYPMGAKLTSDFYNKNYITKNEMNKILSFCLTSGPLFVIGTVGLSFFNDLYLGITVFILHILSSIITGFIFRNSYKNNSSTISFEENVNSNVLYNSMYSSIINIFVVGGFIVIFSIFIDILLNSSLVNFFCENLSHIINIDKNVIKCVFVSIIEMTRGLKELSMLNLNKKTTLVLCGSIISFSGLSIFMQSFAFLGKDVNKKYFILVKLCQVLIYILLSSFVGCFLFQKS